MIRWLVGRLHVGASDREVVEYVLDRVHVKPAVKGDAARRAVLADVAHEALEAHRSAGALYDSIYGRGRTDLEKEITERLYGGAENRAAIEAAEEGE